MALYESAKGTFDGNEQTHAFTYRAGFIMFWSPDKDFYVELDDSIDSNSFLWPKDTVFMRWLGCKVLHYKAGSAGGSIYIWGEYVTPHQQIADA